MKKFTLIVLTIAISTISPLISAESIKTTTSTETITTENTSILNDSTTSAVTEPAIVTTTEPNVDTTTTDIFNSDSNPIYPSIHQIRIIPFHTEYVADPTVPFGQEVIVQTGIDRRESVMKTYIDNEVIIDIEVLTEMVPQISHVHPNDERVQTFDLLTNAKPIPEPTVTNNPFDQKNGTCFRTNCYHTSI